jgi:formylglycine-generating enzyme required for sulfatase activity
MTGPSDAAPMDDSTVDAAMMGMDGAMGMDAGPCPSGMAFVAADAGVCVDLYEGALVVADGGAAWPWFDPIDSVDAAMRAVPANALYPQGYISQVQATAACKAAGKRLCTLEEWTAACRGQPQHDYLYPYGDTYDKTACNEGRESPIVRLFPNPTYSYQELNDPRCDQLDAGLAHGGDFPKCKSSYGAFDMHGNLHEWIDDSPNGDPSKGSFMGGYFVDAKLNGPGCTYRTTAHAKTYHDYSTGFRCCADPVK